MENKKFFDVNKYKQTKKDSGDQSVTKSIKRKKKITSETVIIDEDDHQMKVKDYFNLLEDGDGVMIHCPISPTSHKNNDANASCSMKKNGNYLNLKCFGCDGKATINFGKSKTKNASKNEVIYTVPDFNKDDVLSEVAQGLNNMTSIVAELVRLLPALIQEEKKDD